MLSFVKANTQELEGVSNTFPPATAANVATSVLPEFIRLPKPGQHEPWTGLTRSCLNSLVLPTRENNFRPPVKSISLRKPGTARGVRLIHLQSLMDYLNGKALEVDRE